MLINFDLAGAEWVVVAYLTRDPTMLEVVKSGKSPHVVTGMRFSDLPEDLILKDHKLVGENRNPELIRSLREEHIPEIYKGSYVPRTMSIRQAGKKCLVGETEVLTYKGWKRIDSLVYGEHVAQSRVPVGSSIEFVVPTELHAYNNNEPLIYFEGRHFSQIVTAEHKMPLRHSKKQDVFKEIEADLLPSDTKWNSPYLRTSGE